MANEPFQYFARTQSTSTAQPFKPLTIRASPGKSSAQPSSLNERPTKRRRLSADGGPSSSTQLASTARVSSPIATTEPRHKLLSAPPSHRRPLEVLPNPPGLSTTKSPQAQYYRVVWRKLTNKKNKTWDGDGILIVINGQASLQDESGRSLGRMSVSQPFESDGIFSMAGKEVEIDMPISREDFLRSRAQSQVKPALPVAKTRLDQPRPAPLRVPIVAVKPELKDPSKTPTTRLDDLIIRRGFKQPLKESTVLPQTVNGAYPTPRHDPNALGALIMKRPAAVPAGAQITDVVVDPLLSKKLREHQRAGVSFLYECLMGMNSTGARGAILAHEMGLGKTLTTIALIWTMLKQTPYYGEQPIVKKVMIVCPATLIENWRKEFVKWLGRDRVGVYIAGEKRTRITDFTKGKQYNVCIIGYERLRTVQKDLQKGAAIDLVVADEGHRLKTATNKSAAAIETLNTEKRIILSGTPIQNNLGELFHMVNFVNPNSLGKWSNFRKDFELSIDKGREPNASIEDIQKGEERSEELQAITDAFTHRRSADILDKLLPPKTEYVIFCRPTAAQVQIYRAVLNSFGGAPGSWDGALPMINVLKKLCNSPLLLTNPQTIGKDEELATSSTSAAAALAAIPEQLRNLRLVSGSGKMRVLDRLLFLIHETTKEKVVLVSNYTSTLDQFDILLANRSYPSLRLDGSTPLKHRQARVDAFNSTPASQNFAFILSAKAGGVGLNLIGASRVILFDCDWNPSTDLQAMARVHRDGQKREVRIYRLITKGCLDEKIFQRQSEKRGLADRVMDGKAGKSTFSKEELRDLFRIDESPGCRTHELLSCDCGGMGHSARAADVDDDGAMIDDDDDNEDEHSDPEADQDLPDLPALPQILFASQLDTVAQEAQLEARKDRARRANSRNKAPAPGRHDNKIEALQSLMAYSHIDCSPSTTRTSPAAARAADAPAEPSEPASRSPSRVRARSNRFDPDGGDSDSVSEAPAPVPVSAPVEEEEPLPSMDGLGGLVEDSVLLKVVQRCEGMVDYVFAKTSTGRVKVAEG